MKRTIATGLLLLPLLVFGAPSMTSAAAPPLLPVQGYLTDDADMPLTGVYKVTFTLFDAESAGTSLFTTTEPVTVTKGRFTVYLGDKQQLQLDKLHHANAVWLEVTIVQSCGSDASCTSPTAVNKTLAPRLQFATAAFAASAAFCTSADNAAALGGMSVAELQPKIADVACGPNKFVSSFQAGVPVCASGPTAAASTGTATPAQSSLPDVGCAAGQLLQGISGGQPVCVARPMDGRDGADGKDGATGARGLDGTNGTNGKDGAPGPTPTRVATYKIDGSNTRSVRTQPHTFCSLTRVATATNTPLDCRLDPDSASALPSPWTLQFTNSANGGICSIYCW